MIYHKDLQHRWKLFSLAFQLANVGSEVSRAINAKKRNDTDAFQEARSKSLELLSFTLDDPKHKHRLKELCRLYEATADFFFGENIYGSTEDNMNDYFMAFGILAARERQLV